jgi:hypothetical protein
MKVVLDESSRRPTQHARLTKRVLELEEQLSAARKNKERVKALAELTKAGYVYACTSSLISAPSDDVRNRPASAA